MPRPPEPPDFPASQLFLRRLAYSLVHDAARAEDLVQDTWAAWVEHRPSGVGEPKAWLARVLRNRAFNLKRGEERRARRETFAGRPDPSNPETDGTLEAQAKLIEALRELEEPYRSTLVQRYYHDLAPKEIAERAGTPLNTVKARLARGLAKLRTAMDQRYRGDRKAWCHWLTVLGAPPVPMTPAGTGSSGGGPLALGAGGSVLTAVGAAAILVLGAVWRSDLLRTPERESRPNAQPVAPPIPRTVVEPGRAAREEGVPPDPGSGLESPVPHPSTPLTPAQPQTLHEPQLTALTTPRSAFEWRQYGGGPEHDHSRALEDDIHAPRVLWFVPGCLGQPTLAGDDLYSGGLGLARLDPDTGNPKGIFLDLSELSEAELDLTGSLDHILAQLALVDPSTLETITTRLGEVAAGERGFDVFGPAPVITSDLVLVRRTNDVLAFDRGLSRVWSWDSELDASPQDSPSRAPLCLTDTGIVLVSFSRELVALDASDGHEVWRFPTNGTIEMAPAASGERVFFGMDRGLFVALSAGTGRVLWQKEARGFGTSGPMVVGERVFVADDPYKPWAIRSGSMLLHAWDVSSGASLWEAPLFRGGRLRTGLSFCKATGQLVAPTVTSVEHYDIANGKHDFRQPSLKSAPSGTAVVVGNRLVFADDEGRLNVHDLESSEVLRASASGAIGYAQETENRDNGLRWAFQPPEQAKVEDFVHTGDRIYVATTIGLFCLADDPTRAPPAAGFVLSCEDGSYLPPFFAREK